MTPVPRGISRHNKPNVTKCSHHADLRHKCSNKHKHKAPHKIMPKEMFHYGNIKTGEHSPLKPETEINPDKSNATSASITAKCFKCDRVHLQPSVTPITKSPAQFSPAHSRFRKCIKKMQKHYEKDV